MLLTYSCNHRRHMARVYRSHYFDGYPDVRGSRDSELQISFSAAIKTPLEMALFSWYIRFVCEFILSISVHILVINALS